MANPFAALRDFLLPTPKAAPVVVTRRDGIANVVTGLGTNRDKRTATTFAPGFLDELSAEELWQGHDIAARIIETEGALMFRQGFRVTVQDSDGEDAADINDVVDGLCIGPTFADAISMQRGFGGCALWLGADDGQAMDQPLKFDAIKSFAWCRLLRPRECQPGTYETDRLSPNFGEVRTWRVQREVLNGAAPVVDVHASRIVPFMGVAVSTRQRQQRNGWGAPVMERIFEKLFDFDASYAASAGLVQDFAQGIFQLEGLTQALAAGEDEAVLKRAQNIDLMRSTLRAILLDKNDSFTRLQTPVSGLDGLLVGQTNRLAAAAEMPVSLLMGQAPAGLNATGDTNLRHYYDAVAGRRTQLVKPLLLRVLRVVLAAKDGPTGGVVPEKWGVDFPSMYQQTEGEKADTRAKLAQADVAYINAGVLMPEEVAHSRFGGDSFNMETTLDVEARESMPTSAELAAAQLEAQAKPGEKPTKAAPKDE